LPAKRYDDCQSCGKKLTGKQLMYCSEKCCNRESKRLQRVAEAQGRVVRLCEVCGKEMAGVRTNHKPIFLTWAFALHCRCYILGRHMSDLYPLVCHPTF